ERQPGSAGAPAGVLAGDGPRRGGAGAAGSPEYADSAMASWAYGRLLVAFRQEGATERSRNLLSQALELNAHIPPYLLGRKPLPTRSPDHIGFGDESE